MIDKNVVLYDCDCFRAKACNGGVYFTTEQTIRTIVTHNSLGEG